MPAINPFASGYTDGPLSSAVDIINITKDDNNDLAVICRWIWVGTGGDVAVIVAPNTNTAAPTTKIHKNVPSGSFIGPAKFARVLSTGSTGSADLLGYV